MVGKDFIDVASGLSCFHLKRAMPRCGQGRFPPHRRAFFRRYDDLLFALDSPHNVQQVFLAVEWVVV
jgi:hypothetical protein